MLFHSAMAVYGLLFALFFVWMLRSGRLSESWSDASVGDTTVRRRLLGLVVMAGASMARLACAPLLKGHPIDFNDFTAWALHAYSHGLSHFYEGIFADYPPGYVYILYLIGFLQHLFALQTSSPLFMLLLKFPAMTADLISGWLIYLLAARRLAFKPAIALASLYLFNPLVFLDSVLWSQIDSVFTLFILLLVVAVTEKKLAAAAVLFAVALLIKPQSLMFAPLLLFALVERSNWRASLRAILYAGASFVCLLIPFSVGRNPLWIVALYRKMFAIYPYASLNAFNAYALIGANGERVSGTWLHVPFHGWEGFAMLSILLLVTYLFAATKHNGRLPYIALLLTQLVFLLKTGMHERYGYPAAALALVGYIYCKDRRILYIFVGVSLTHFANTAYVLGLSFNKHYFIFPHDPVMAIVSLANVLITAYAVYVGLTLQIHRDLRYNGKDQFAMEGQPFGTALLQIRHDEQR